MQACARSIRYRLASCEDRVWQQDFPCPVLFVSGSPYLKGLQECVPTMLCVAAYMVDPLRGSHVLPVLGGHDSITLEGDANKHTHCCMPLCHDVN